jgi:glycosyltransferase involved in cell wall biosynthesis
MKNIGIFHYKVGGTDGVSLEIDKWKQVLEEMGHQVFLCAGDLGTAQGTLIEEMYHHRPDAERLYRNTFLALQDYDEAVYMVELEQLAAKIEDKLRRFIAEKKINFLIPENVWSVAANPAVALAMRRVMRELQIPALAHSHDFYWERVDGVALTCSTAVELADKYLPPRDPSVKHALINSLAQRELLARKGIESVVVPNVFDFDEEAWAADNYNKDFRAQIGLGENDIFILQATRIVQRKSIELAVDFVKALGSPERRARLRSRGLYDGRSFGSSDRIVLVLAGYTQDDTAGHYVGRLKQKIAETGIEAIFIEEQVGGCRQTVDGQKVYSLWDSYVFADFVTYPSLWEGWGNQLLEALRARLPFMIFEYPVYEADIKDKGFRAVSLGSQLLGQDDQGLVTVADELVESAADEAVDLLVDNNLRQETVEHNFRVAQEHYSLSALRRYLENLVGYE